MNFLHHQARTLSYSGAVRVLRMQLASAMVSKRKPFAAIQKYLLANTSICERKSPHPNPPPQGREGTQGERVRSTIASLNGTRSVEETQSQTAENDSVFSFLSSISFLLHRDKRKEIDINPAFTMAEVLIVLGILGLVADMTIPTLVQSTQEKITVTRLKRVYSTFENAYRMAVNDNGTPENWKMSTVGDAFNPFDVLGKYIKITKNCGDGMGCFPDVTYKMVDKQGPWGNWNRDKRATKVQIVDGVSVAAAIGKTCDSDTGTSPALKQSCGGLYIDINGFKEPNVIGVDMFYFRFTKLGIVPWGTQQDTAYTFDNFCVNKYAGWGCTAWVIYNENMDYLHCDDLSWDGKKTCN